MLDQLPESVRLKALAQGAAGARWLSDLPALVEQLEETWQIRVTAVMHGGTAALVAGATTAGGDQVVLKVAIPDGLRGNGPFADELQAMVLGSGHGYARVLRHDLGRRALLLEKLGPPVAELGLAVGAEMTAIAETLRQAWRPLAQPWPLPSGHVKAQWLAGDIQQSLGDLPVSCHPKTAAVALAFAAARAAAFDPSVAVLIHGDAHPYNVLLDTAEPSGSVFKLVDPEGLVSEPAHDLAIPLRQFSGKDLSGQAIKDHALGLCAVLSDTAMVNPRPIWEWAFVERVTTGLFLSRLGQEQDATEFLRVANELVGAGP